VSEERRKGVGGIDLNRDRRLLTEKEDGSKNTKTLGRRVKTEGRGLSVKRGPASVLRAPSIVKPEHPRWGAYTAKWAGAKKTKLKEKTHGRSELWAAKKKCGKTPSRKWGHP